MAVGLGIEGRFATSVPSTGPGITRVTFGLIVTERNGWIRVSPQAATPLRAIEAFGEALCD